MVLFEDDEIDKEEKKAKNFLNNFFKAEILWNNKEYIQTQLIHGRYLEFQEGIAIFYNRIFNFIKNNTELTEEELRNSLVILIKENKLLTYKNILLTNEFIKNGFYNNELEFINTEIELAKLNVNDFL